jgi:hypothetical protein
MKVERNPVFKLQVQSKKKNLSLERSSPTCSG